MAAPLPPLTFERALAIVVRRGKGAIAPNTVVYQAGVDDAGRAVLAVRLYSTVVARLYADGRVELFANDWLTTTTKRRLNAVLPPGCCIGSDKGLWYVYGPTRRGKRARTPFRDGLTLDADGCVIA